MDEKDAACSRSLIRVDLIAALATEYDLLKEQKTAAPKRVAALDDYLSRWVRWTTAELGVVAPKPVSEY